MSDDNISLAALFRSKLGLEDDTTPLQIWESCMKFYETTTQESLKVTLNESRQVEVTIMQIVDWARAEFGDDVANGIQNREWLPEPEGLDRADVQLAINAIQQTATTIISIVRPHNPDLADKLERAYTMDDITRARVLAEMFGAKP